MGIVSIRVNPITDNNHKLHETTADTYSVHKYFYPKPLKTGKKIKMTNLLIVDNLEKEIRWE